MSRLTLLFCLLLLPLYAVAADALLQVKIIGANKEQSKNIQAHLGSLPTTPDLRASYIFSASKSAEKALQAIGYYHASVTVELDQSKPTWLLKLTVSPGEPVMVTDVKLDIQGEASLLPIFTQLAQNLGLKANQKLNHGLYNEVKVRLVSQGLEMGFFQGELKESRIEINRERNTASILLSYASGPRATFGQTIFQGTDLDPELLHQMQPFSEGEPYNANRISDFHSQLVSSGYFSGIKLLPSLSRNQDGKIPVLAELSPAPSHKVDLGAGYATDTQARASVTWRTPQVNRHGHSQETRLELSEVNPYLRFRYQIPWSHPNNDILQLGLNLESDEFADLTSTQYSALVGRLSKSEGWLRQVELKFHNEQWSIFNDHFRTRFMMPSVTYSKLRRKGNPVDPEAGFRQLYRLTLGLPLAGTDSNIVRAQSQFRFVETLAEKHRFVARARLGAAWFQDRNLDDVPPSLRFYAGGDQSMRGFAYQSLGPNLPYVDDQGEVHTLTTGGRYLAVGSLEYQYYLTDKWRLATFTDFGNAFDKVAASLRPAYSVGVGGHWLSPVGAVKLEIGYGTNKVEQDDGSSENEHSWRVHISMGTEL